MNKLEQKLIFGGTLENINDIISLDEEMGSGNAKMKALKAESDAEKLDNPIDQTQAKITAGKMMKVAKDIEQKEEMKVSQTNKKKLESGGLNEGILSDIKKKSLSSKIEKLQVEKNKVQETADKKKEVLDKKITSAKVALDKITGEKTSEPVDNPEVLKESSNRNTMIFNGFSGDALKYFVTGEINNINKNNLEIAKMMKNQPEVKVVIKKISKLYNKDLSDSEYFELKNLKLKFRMLFNTYREKYKERFNK